MANNLTKWSGLWYKNVSKLSENTGKLRDMADHLQSNTDYNGVSVLYE